MATIASEPPSQAEGSGLFTIASYNIQSGCNGGLESALRAMKLMGVELWSLLRDKIDQGGVHALEQRLQRPQYPCTKQVARRD
jgi:hypothetical protein